MNRQIRQLAGALIALYVMLFAALNYWQVNRTEELARANHCAGNAHRGGEADELNGAVLVPAEAQSLGADAGRVSCAHPFDAWMRASALWRWGVRSVFTDRPELLAVAP